MGRFLVVSALALVGVAGSFSMIGCGGGDKPPLTPDTTEPGSSSGGSGTPSDADAAAPASPAPAK